MRNVCRSAVALACCVLGAAHVVWTASLKESEHRHRQNLDPVHHQQRQPESTLRLQRRTRGAEQWLALISEIARLGAITEMSRIANSESLNARTNTVFLPPPIQLSGNSTVQLVVVPVAIPHEELHYKSISGVTEYKQGLQFDSGVSNIASLLIPSNVSPANNRQYFVDGNIDVKNSLPQINIPKPIYVSQSVNSRVSTPTLQSPQAVVYETTGLSSGSSSQQRFPIEDNSAQISIAQTPQAVFYRTNGPPTGISSQQEHLVEEDRAKTSAPQSPQVVYETSTPLTSRPSQHRLSIEERRARNTPVFLPVDDSQQLVQQFRAQLPRTPSLPPVVTEPLVVTSNDDVVDVPDPTQEPTRNTTNVTPKDTETCRSTCQDNSNFGDTPDHAGSDNTLPSPPIPRFERSVKIEAVLTVPSADYSEPYTIWWDAASGASRIEHHDGTASSYRIIRSDGRLQSVHVRLDRTGETDVQRCTLVEPRRIALAERALPILPNLSEFKFAGYLEVKPTEPPKLSSRVERWLHSVSAPAGAAGAVSGEVLTYRHELLVARSTDHTITPLRYAVAVDSSVLGPNCESYMHRFLKVFTRNYDSATFSFDADDSCDHIEKIDQLELVEPLREFALLQRDSKYDGALTRYKKLYNRKYKDDVEEAVRKNLLIQSMRFTSSGNRKGASFELESNFAADRLRVELEPLLGIQHSGSGSGDAFPHSNLELRRMSGRLPKKFDWRERGAVTHVRQQGTCASCWAHSVVGAVEGALFTATGRLVALSEQSLVDCGKRSGANGCKPTWPRFAYDYIRDNGIPALDEYSPYVAKEQQCAEELVAPVTRISSHVNVTAENLRALKVAIRRHGPTVVLIDGLTSSLFSYKTGFYFDAKCKKQSSTHAMVAVGWTTHRGETYFILKNSWGSGWGQGGYLFIRGKTNTCGILRQPSYPVVSRSDVLRVPSSAQAAPLTPTN